MVMEKNEQTNKIKENNSYTQAAVRMFTMVSTNSDLYRNSDSYRN